MAQTTPMIEQYNSIKAQYMDAVLFFRLGDFYEMFNEDAIEVSKLLNLTLTKRALNPMCGVPYHAAKMYISRLLKLGKKIAICEQMSDPIPGQLTERKVIEVITPGTAVEDSLLEGVKNNYLAAVFCSNKKVVENGNKETFCAFAYIDVSTGDFYATRFFKSSFISHFQKELDSLRPNEILIQKSLLTDIPDLQNLLDEYPMMLKNFYPDWSFESTTLEKRLCEHFNVHNLKAFGLESGDVEIPVAGLLLDYIKQTAGPCLSHIISIKKYSDHDYLILDDSTRKNLELVTNLRDATNSYTLFEILNNTKTVMGTRLLQEDIIRPMCNYGSIIERQEMVLSLYQNEKLLANIRKELALVLDIQRLVSKVVMNKATGKDLLSLKQSLKQALTLNKLSQQYSSFFLKLSEQDLNTLSSLVEMLEKSINEECSTLLTDAKLIKLGWSQELDGLKNIRNNAQEILSNYLEEEKEKTGLQKLKIKCNRMHGYFFEITKLSLSETPEHFMLLKDLKTSKMFSTEKLNEIESKIENAESSIAQLEKRLFTEIIEKLVKSVAFLLQLSKDLARLDVLQSFAHTAVLHYWVKPEISQDGLLEITEGRHPVVESHLPQGEFIPNDLSIDSNEVAFALITGPNMAGKSTFLRQNALIVLLAQMGSFVPASKAHISICDRIFCRVGASDNVARGESTFLVEMLETAFILQNATQNSLVIMDEVGRGTSTQDGLAIAQAVTEYLLNNIKAKTIFATHYHELGSLSHKALCHLKLDVAEEKNKIVFLKKVIPGVSENSYGIQVAGIAGVPHPVIERAKSILSMLSSCKAGSVVNIPETQTKNLEAPKSKALFDEGELILGEISAVDLDNLKPIEALHLIQLWKEELQRR